MSASAVSCNKNNKIDLDDLSDVDYDYLEQTPSPSTSSSSSGSIMKKLDDDNQNAEETPLEKQYILGTLMVRIVSARNLSTSDCNGGSGGIASLLFRSSRSSSRNTSGSTTPLSRDRVNPFAKMQYGNQMQRTTQMYDTCNPSWSRLEQFYFDVTIPIRDEEEKEGEVERKKEVETKEESLDSNLIVSMYHSEKTGYSPSKYSKQTSNTEEMKLGCITVDMTPIITGKLSTIDTWCQLSPASELRIQCEYEPTDPPPQIGDICRLIPHCHSSHISSFLPTHGLFTVDNILNDGDTVVLSYTAQPEGWLCTFPVHRYMILCEKRHRAFLEEYYNQFCQIREKLSVSPLVKTLEYTLHNSVPEDGLVGVGKQVAVESIALFGRWLEGGLDTAKEDVIYVTNWDGSSSQHRQRTDDTPTQSPPLQQQQEYEEEDEDDDQKLPPPLPGMACCPITGEPMRNPVVAADGHTYEKRAIQRWLKNSNRSPLTGSVLPHAELVPNYLLLSSFDAVETL